MKIQLMTLALLVAIVAGCSEEDFVPQENGMGIISGPNPNLTYTTVTNEDELREAVEWGKNILVKETFKVTLPVTVNDSVNLYLESDLINSYEWLVREGGYLSISTNSHTFISESDYALQNAGGTIDIIRGSKIVAKKCVLSNGSGTSSMDECSLTGAVVVDGGTVTMLSEPKEWKCGTVYEKRYPEDHPIRKGWMQVEGLEGSIICHFDPTDKMYDRSCYGNSYVGHIITANADSTWTVTRDEDTYTYTIATNEEELLAAIEKGGNIVVHSSSSGHTLTVTNEVSIRDTVNLYLFSDVNTEYEWTVYKGGYLSIFSNGPSFISESAAAFVNKGGVVDIVSGGMIVAWRYALWNYSGTSFMDECGLKGAVIVDEGSVTLYSEPWEWKGGTNFEDRPEDHPFRKGWMQVVCDGSIISHFDPTDKIYDGYNLLNNFSKVEHTVTVNADSIWTVTRAN